MCVCVCVCTCVFAHVPPPPLPFLAPLRSIPPSCPHQPAGPLQPSPALALVSSPIRAVPETSLRSPRFARHTLYTAELQWGQAHGSAQASLADRVFGHVPLVYGGLHSTFPERGPVHSSHVQSSPRGLEFAAVFPCIQAPKCGKSLRYKHLQPGPGAQPS